MKLYYIVLVAILTVASSHQPGQIFEEDMVWDERVSRFYNQSGETVVMPSVSNDIGEMQALYSSTAGNGSYVWDIPDHKTSDNDGSLTYLIPYQTSDMTDDQSVIYIKIAMKKWNKGTCVLFVPRTTETNFVNFVPGGTCSSHVGMVGGPQNVTINDGCKYHTGSLLHELGHVLGLFHEHTRIDRDQYVQILTHHLDNGLYDMNFEKMVDRPKYVRDGGYDYLSIMHYGSTDSSKAPYNLTTIRTLDPAYQDLIGQRVQLTQDDIEKVNYLYNCDCKLVNSTYTYKRGYWGECQLLWFRWKCLKEEEVTEIQSKKVCTKLT